MFLLHFSFQTEVDQKFKNPTSALQHSYRHNKMKMTVIGEGQYWHVVSENVSHFELNILIHESYFYF